MELDLIKMREDGWYVLFGTGDWPVDSFRRLDMSRHHVLRAALGMAWHSAVIESLRTGLAPRNMSAPALTPPMVLVGV
eukprot:3005458-Rhodomonas_salina.2